MNHGTAKANAIVRYYSSIIWSNLQGITVDSLNAIDSIKGYDKKTTLLMFICKTIKNVEPKIKVFFDDLLTLEDALKVDISDIETKLKDHEKGYKFL